MEVDAAPANLRTWYADPGLLRARQQLQVGTFVDWVLNLVSVEPVHRVLDAGAGVGRFTGPLARRCRDRGVQVVACDLFPGMVGSIRDSLTAEGLSVDVALADIGSLPFHDSTFELVLANHVLYHLPDIQRGITELARVIRPDGTLVATTNADDIAIAVIELHNAVLDRLGVTHEPEAPSTFSLRNGEEQLRPAFHDVALHVYRDELVFTQPSQLIAAYQTTGRFKAAHELGGVPAGALLAAADEICAEWFRAAGGSLRSPIVLGAFVCTQPGPG
jgi:SAM-dependent methyltransferase